MVHSKIHLSARKITTIAFVVIFLCVSGLVIAYAQKNTIKELEKEKAIEATVEVEKKPQENQRENINIGQALIQKCPEIWIDNQVSGAVREGEVTIIEGYMILDGEKVKLNQVDLKWVDTHCQIKKQTGY